MHFRASLRLFVVLLAVVAFTGCREPDDRSLPPTHVNLVFVTSPDLLHDGGGDVDSLTANLTNQGLQRSLLLAAYLKGEVLGNRNVSGIYALSPATHRQTPAGHPDMAGLGYIQQFALQNQVTIRGTTGNSFPIAACYAPGAVPEGVVQPASFPPDCRGLDYTDTHGVNVAAALRIIDAGVAGYYVFSAPWETIRALMEKTSLAKGYGLVVPAAYPGPNRIHAISVSPQQVAELHVYDAALAPPNRYPTLPDAVRPAACNQQQAFFSARRSGGVDGAVVPPGMNRNSTVHLIRHAEAHPSSAFEDGNYVAAGQWRALALPHFLRDRIHPDRVYSIDPAQPLGTNGFGFSYVRPSLTVLPYAIAKGLPLDLVTGFELNENPNDPGNARDTMDFFFRGGRFTGSTVLVAWEHEHFPPLVTTLLQSYGGSEPLPALDWPTTDYDTIWTVRLDAQGNVSVDNGLCEGIDSASLPWLPPTF